MSQFIESICVKNGIAQHIALHEQRMLATQQYFFKHFQTIDLSNVFQIPTHLQQETLLKWRIIYDTKIISITWEKYIPKIVQRIALAKCDLLDYKFKLKDRMILNELLLQNNHADDILIVQDNLITDASYANLVFETDDNTLFTPTSFLLNGIKRQFYLSQHFITEQRITIDNIKQFRSVHFINAMLDIGDLTLSINAETIHGIDFI